jgi:hypothetical protein
MGKVRGETIRPELRRDLKRRAPPPCSICSDSMVAPEASVFRSVGEVSYLWSCDSCGCSFVTEVALSQANLR